MTGRHPLPLFVEIMALIIFSCSDPFSVLLSFMATPRHFSTLGWQSAERWPFYNHGPPPQVYSAKTVSRRLDHNLGRVCNLGPLRVSPQQKLMTVMVKQDLLYV